MRRVAGVERQFFDYQAHGAPYGPDDGTLAPWVVVASLPFAPEIVVPTIRAMARLDLGACCETARGERRLAVARHVHVEVAIEALGEPQVLGLVATE
jgi:hypothetical protein